MKSIAQGIRDLEALTAPSGVAPADFQKMKDQLKALLIAKSIGKQVSAAPKLDVDKVALQAQGYYSDGHVSLTWDEKLNGDYDDGGEVYINDLVPLAQYYGDRTDDNVPPTDGRAIVDGDGTPQIDIGDLAPIADNYEAGIDGYEVWRKLDNSSPWVSLTSITRPAPPSNHSARPSYTYSDTNLAQQYRYTVQYKVRPYQGTDEGIYCDAQYANWPSSTVSGQVTGSNVSGVLVSLYKYPGGYDPSYQATTGLNGRYSITGVYNGSYLLIPSKSGYSYTPWDRSVTVSGSNVTGQDFTSASSSNYTVSGHVMNKYDSDLGMYHVDVVLVGPNGQTADQLTDADGYYSISNVPSGAYKLYLAKQGCLFDVPVYSFVTVANSNISLSDFHGWGVLQFSPWPSFRQNTYNTGQATGCGPLYLYQSTYKW